MIILSRNQNPDPAHVRLQPGDLVKVTITDSDEYDLYAKGT